MSNLPILGLREFTNAGAPLAGGKLYFYVHTSSTLKNTYPSEADMIAGTNANANPVVADANGRFGEIYLLTDEAYKVVLKTSADVTIETWDDVTAVSLGLSSVEVRQKQIASNPLDYGAVGDGVADESAEVQDAIDNATGVVDLLGKTFRCDSQIVLRSGITLRNGTLNFASCADDEYVVAIGSHGSDTLLTGNAAVGDEHIHVTSADGISVGGWLFLHATDAFGGGADGVGEIVRVKSINSLEITLVDPLIDDYTTANNAACHVLTMAERISVQDVEITCAVGSSGAGRALYFDVCDGVSVSNVRINTPKSSGVEMRFTANSSVTRSTVIGSAVTGVGFEIGASSRNVICDANQAYLLDIGFRIGQVDTHDGVTRMVTAQNCCALGCGTTGFKVAVNAEYNTISGIATTIAGAAAVTDSGSNTRILGVQDINPIGTSDGMLLKGSGAGSGVDATGGATNGVGVYGRGGGSNGWGVIGSAAAGGTGHGVSGSTNGSGIGVNGSSNTGYGLYGSSSSSNGIRATSTTNVAAWFIGNSLRGPLHLEPSAAPSGANVIGDIYVTTAGIPYICTVAGTPGTWTKISAT